MKTYKIHTVTDSWVLISDLDNGRSVTNSAAAVVRELNSQIEKGLGKRRVYYRDSMGRYDELRHERGEFKGFSPCSENQQSFLAKHTD